MLGRTAGRIAAERTGALGWLLLELPLALHRGPLPWQVPRPVMLLPAAAAALARALAGAAMLGAAVLRGGAPVRTHQTQHARGQARPLRRTLVEGRLG